MNHCYKLVFNRSLNLWQAVSELARSRGKSARATVRSVMIIVTLTGAAAVQAQSVTTSESETLGLRYGYVLQGASYFLFAQPRACRVVCLAHPFSCRRASQE
jgi:hypothetical protein